MRSLSKKFHFISKTGILPGCNLRFLQHLWEIDGLDRQTEYARLPLRLYDKGD
jgi:hypothetical protein